MADLVGTCTSLAPAGRYGARSVAGPSRSLQAGLASWSSSRTDNCDVPSYPQQALEEAEASSLACRGLPQHCLLCAPVSASGAWSSAVAAASPESVNLSGAPLGGFY